MMNAMSWCFFFLTLLSIFIGCWGAHNNYKDTACSGVIGAFCFGICILIAAAKY